MIDHWTVATHGQTNFPLSTLLKFHYYYYYCVMPTGCYW